jgi:hypothetical protein
VPPLSLVIAYWMLGAFFMGMKRYAEYPAHRRSPAGRGVPPVVRVLHRGTLLVSIFFYATTCALFSGIFIVRYHLELILFAPVGAGVFAYYLQIG